MLEEAAEDPGVDLSNAEGGMQGDMGFFHFLVGEREVQRAVDHRLAHVPGCIDEALDAVALGIREVERPAATV